MMMATGIVAGSVAGWSPIGTIGRRSGEGSRFSQDGRAKLEDQEGVEVHPDTSPHDPIISKQPEASHTPPSQVPETTPPPVKPGPSTLAPPQPA